MTIARARLLLCALLIGLCALACARRVPAGAPAPSATPRVAALAPGLAEMVRAHAPGAQVVGRHAFDAWTDPAVPIVGDQAGIDFEALLAARPTHVLFQDGATGTPPRLRQLAQVHNWQLLSGPLLTLADVQAMQARVHEVLRTEASAAAHAPAPLVLRSARDLSRAGRVLLLHTRSPIAALGPGSYHAELLAGLGATPAITTGLPYQTLDAEDVRALAPDVILVIDPRAPSQAPPAAAPDLTAPDLAALVGPTLARLRIPAIVHRRVALIDDPQALIPGPSLARVAQQMERALTPWAQAPEP
jgi:ABC-type hemin transport system substrate-binding protein